MDRSPYIECLFHKTNIDSNSTMLFSLDYLTWFAVLLQSNVSNASLRMLLYHGNASTKLLVASRRPFLNNSSECSFKSIPSVSSYRHETMLDGASQTLSFCTSGKVYIVSLVPNIITTSESSSFFISRRHVCILEQCQS
jgi:hypothetical protein